MADNPKPYDQAFKFLSDADPRGLLDVLGVLPESVEASVEPLPRDIAARPLAVDAGYFVRPVGAPAFIAVFEALTTWKFEIGARLAAYGAFVGDRYKLPVRMYVLPLARYACPRRPPEMGRVRWGDVEVKIQLRWILPWKIDAGLLLAKGSTTLDPWVVLFHFTKPQLFEAVTRLIPRREDASLLRILGGMRYRRDTKSWISLLGRIENMITRETLRESLAVQEWLSEGRVEGARGQAQAMLSKLLGKRFPRLKLDAEIQSINEVEVLNELISLAIDSKSAASLARKIEQAARSTRPVS